MVKESQQYAWIAHRLGKTLDYAETVGHVVKLYCRDGNYSVKRLNNPDAKFLYSVEQIRNKGFHHFLPILKPSQNEWMIRDNKHSYIVMPWVDENVRKNDHDVAMMKKVAKLHALSAKTYKISERQVQHLHQSYGENDAEETKQLESFIEECEGKVYMSPFELCFAEHFFRIMQINEFSKKELNNWNERVTEEKEFRTVMNHGNVSSSHYLIDSQGKGWFINYTEMETAPPVYDISSYILNELGPYSRYVNNDWIVSYLSYFELKEYEFALLFHHLTRIDPIVKVVKEYKDNRNGSEYEYVRKLQKTVWKLFHMHEAALQIEQWKNRKENEEMDREDG